MLTFTTLGDLVARPDRDHHGVRLEQRHSQDPEAAGRRRGALGRGGLALLEQVGVDAQQHRHVREADGDAALGVEGEGAVRQRPDDRAPRPTANCPDWRLYLRSGWRAYQSSSRCTGSGLVRPSRFRVPLATNRPISPEQPKSRVGERDADRELNADLDGHEVVVDGERAVRAEAGGDHRDGQQRADGARVSDRHRALPEHRAGHVDNRGQAAQLDRERIQRQPDCRALEPHDAQVEGELQVELHPGGAVADSGRRNPDQVPQRSAQTPLARIGDFDAEVVVGDAHGRQARLGGVEAQAHALVAELDVTQQEAVAPAGRR